MKSATTTTPTSKLPSNAEGNAPTTFAFRAQPKIAALLRRRVKANQTTITSYLVNLILAESKSAKSAKEAKSNAA